MTEEEFEKEMREREYKRQSEKERNAVVWLLLALPVICILNPPIGTVCIAVTVAYYAFKAIARWFK